MAGAKIIIRESRVLDCEMLGPNLRKADLLDLEGHDPVKALKDGLAGLICRTGVYKGEVCGMFGVSSPMDMKEHGYWAPVWLLGSDVLVARARRSFLKQCRKELTTLEGVKGIDYLFNRVHHRNVVHLRWIVALGFDVIRTDKPAVFINFLKRVSP